MQSCRHLKVYYIWVSHSVVPNYITYDEKKEKILRKFREPLKTKILQLLKYFWDEVLYQIHNVDTHYSTNIRPDNSFSCIIDRPEKPYILGMFRSPEVYTDCDIFSSSDDDSNSDDDGSSDGSVGT